LPATNVPARLSELEDLENSAQPILFTNLCHNAADLVVIDEIRFQQVSPPGNCSGEGGIVYLTLRTVQ
jgi:hypothetical protein